MTPAELNQLIRKRRSIFPRQYVDKAIPKEIIQQILENANWAPSHKLTQPWRFKVLTGNALKRLSQFLGEHYQANTPAEDFSEIKLKKMTSNPLKSNVAIAICMQRDPKESLPEWEELAAVACAVQNMYLTCTAYGVGCYWATPAAALDAQDFLNLKEGERCLGLLYMGYHDGTGEDSKRDPIEEKTVWMEA